MSDYIHIYPVYGRGKSDHITKKHKDCWCNPELKQVCSESNDEGKCEPGCFKCSGSGMVEPYDENLNYLIIHKEHQLNGYNFGEKYRLAFEQAKKVVERLEAELAEAKAKNKILLEGLAVNEAVKHPCGHYVCSVMSFCTVCREISDLKALVRKQEEEIVILKAEKVLTGAITSFPGEEVIKVLSDKLKKQEAVVEAARTACEDLTIPEGECRELAKKFIPNALVDIDGIRDSLKEALSQLEGEKEKSND